MKKISTILAGLILSTTAQAADLPATTYKAPISPATNWTGFYIGAMGGYAFEADRDTTGSDIRGGFGGGTIGYNWQTGPVVFGIEADAAAGDIKDSATLLPGLASVATRIDALGSVRGRLGIAFDNLLLYGTGGFTAANNKLSLTVLGLTFSDSKVHTGWTAGGGVEWVFARNWSLKVEYLYRDFGSENYFQNVVVGGVATGNVRFHSGQIGINYHF